MAHRRLPDDIQGKLQWVLDLLDGAVADKGWQEFYMNFIANHAAAIRDQIDASKEAKLSMFVFQPVLSFEEARWRGLAKLEREQFLQQADLIKKYLCTLRAALAGT
jgi:hypothetical protein